MQPPELTNLSSPLVRQSPVELLHLQNTLPIPPLQTWLFNVSTTDRTHLVTLTIPGQCRERHDWDHVNSKPVSTLI